MSGRPRHDEARLPVTRWTLRAGPDGAPEAAVVTATPPCCACRQKHWRAQSTAAGPASAAGTAAESAFARGESGPRAAAAGEAGAALERAVTAIDAERAAACKKAVAAQHAVAANDAVRAVGAEASATAERAAAAVTAAAAAERAAAAAAAAERVALFAATERAATAASAAERAAAAAAAAPGVHRQAAGIRITDVHQALEAAEVVHFIRHFSEVLDAVVGPSSDGKSRRLLTPITGGDLMLKLSLPRVRARPLVLCARPLCLTLTTLCAPTERPGRATTAGGERSERGELIEAGTRHSHADVGVRGRHTKGRDCCSAFFRKCAPSTAHPLSAPSSRVRGISLR